MSATVARIPRAEAVSIAERFVARLDGTYDRLEIAGSIRRGLPTVGDIEIVAVPAIQPTYQRDMFGDVVSTAQADLLDDRLEELLEGAEIEKRLRSDGKTVWGARMKYLSFEGFPIDLFCCEADRFGVILAIRTGPAAFSHQFVTERGKVVTVGFRADGKPIKRAGLLPSHLRVDGGWLVGRVSGARIPTPSEEDFFEAIGLPYRSPHERR